ncbi:MAG: glycolate oxidase FAD binding subunit [Paracoccaceae bacterium]|jgi:glycolate oxidase FAD binding subunit
MMRPENEAELAEMVAAAVGPLTVRGGGTRGVSVAGDELSTAGLSGLSLYEPGALTLVAGAGTPLAEIEAVLAADSQRLAFEPMDHRGLLGSAGEPTIGGVVAGNVSGPRRVQVGAARDFLLGVRFVDGTGQVIKNGGRVMKNVTGYDLVKLMAGSWGTLGVISEVAFKVLPVPPTQATLRLEGLDFVGAVRAMSAALGSPFEVTGAGFDGSAVLIRIEGFAESVDYRAGRLADLLAPFGAVSRVETTDQSAAIWKAVRDVGAFHGVPGDVWRISVKPSDAPALVARLDTDNVVLDWGGGLIWALMPEGRDLRALTGPFDGHATLVRASDDTKARLGMFQPQSPPLEAISAGLRARFDPRGIFNPGLMSARAGG